MSLSRSLPPNSLQYILRLFYNITNTPHIWNNISILFSLRNKIYKLSFNNIVLFWKKKRVIMWNEYVSAYTHTHKHTYIITHVDVDVWSWPFSSLGEEAIFRSKSCHNAKYHPQHLYMTFGPKCTLNNEHSNNDMKAMIKVNTEKYKRIQGLSMKS